MVQHVTVFWVLNFMNDLSTSTDTKDSVQTVILYLQTEMTELPVAVSHPFRLVLMPHGDTQ